tara:strand:- start:178 stop:345 length:168 start_codon:yes stop_codon:yes gene_type:complete
MNFQKKQLKFFTTEISDMKLKQLIGKDIYTEAQFQKVIYKIIDLAYDSQAKKPLL